MSVGTEVRRRRKEKELTGAQLAARAGLTPSAVSQIETGKRAPSSTSVIKLAEALDIEPGDLFPKPQARLPLEDRPGDAGRQLAKLLQEARALRADEHIETAAAALDRILSERVPTAEEGLVTAEEGLAPTAEEGLFDLLEAVLEENEHLKARISELEAA